jgi:putative tryptophan/tyrosine transport system substrate-binding protein
MNDPQLEGHMASHIERRKFLATLGGAVAAWPLASRAQQPERMRRIGFLHGLVEDDPEAQARINAFRHGLEALGWTEGRNIHVDYRFARGDAGLTQAHADELVSLAPEQSSVFPRRSLRL